MNVTLSRRSLFEYSLLALPLAFANLPLYIHAPDFYATHAGLSLATIGSILLLVRFFDAVQDPLIGFLSNKFAYFRPAIMIVSLLMMGAGLIMLFHPPRTFTLIWFALSLVFTTTAFSVLAINFNAVGSLWSTDASQKTRITSWREALGLMGLLIAAILPSVLGLSLTSIIFAGLLAIAGFVFLHWSTTHSDIIIHNEGPSKPINWCRFLTAPNIKFFGIYSLSMLASAIPAVLVLFFIRDRLDAERFTGLFLLLYFLSGTLAMPLWQYIAQRTNKHNAWLTAMIASIATFIGAYFLRSGDIWQYATICIFSGIALGAELALPPAILSDMIDQQETRDQTLLYFSFLAFLSKAALALGSFIAFFVLEQALFTPATENSEHALQALSFTYALIPSLFKTFAAYVLWQTYQHKGDIHAQIKQLTKRNHSNESHHIS